jgi:hypothetical protein
VAAGYRGCSRAALRSGDVTCLIQRTAGWAGASERLHQHEARDRVRERDPIAMKREMAPGTVPGGGRSS